ncbi:MAG: methyltransferase domain-containing protein [Dehalococcoidales bacterium]|jgi:tellurite methyltransferase
MNENNSYDEKYAEKEYYWGKTPSKMCDQLLEIIKPEKNQRPKLLDLGCGEGKNAVYFARHGCDVTGMDISLPGLEKTKIYAAEAGVLIATVQANIINYQLDAVYDIVFSTGTLHYLPPEVREKRFLDYKSHTANNGINALNVFVKKPFVPKAPDSEDTAFHYKSGELFSYYWDWEILYCTEEIFDCMSSGIPHKHAVNRLIARKKA